MINRGSTMFVNTGAKARAFTVEFNLSLNHIMQSYNPVLNTKSFLQSTFTKSEKERFDIRETPAAEAVSPANQVIRHWRENLLNSMEDAGIDSIKDARTKRSDNLDSWLQTDPFILEEEGRASQYGPDAEAAVAEVESNRLAYEAFRNKTGISDVALRALDSLSFILDIIRTSVAPNQQTTVLGPPLIRIRYGTMYLDVPCICRSFNIDVDDQAGYNLRTLTPNRINITLMLSEVRTGNFGTFKPAVPVERDNLPGWESVLEYGTTDPGLIL